MVIQSYTSKRWSS